MHANDVFWLPIIAAISYTRFIMCFGAVLSRAVFVLRSTRRSVSIGCVAMLLIAEPAWVGAASPPIMLGEPRFYPVGSEPIALAAGDLNDDGFLDLIVVNSDEASVTILHNDGAGRFTRFGANLSTGDATFPSYVAVFRKNADTIDDFVVVREPTEREDPDGDFLGRAMYWSSSRTASGTIRFTVGGSAVVGTSPIFVRSGADVNADDSEDLVIVNSFDDSISVLPNRKSNGFLTRQDIPTVGFPVGVAIADFTQDGRPDIAVAGEDGLASIHINTNGTPRFLACPSCLPFNAGTLPAAIETADLNGDGKADLAIADAGEATIRVHPGLGNGTFGPPTILPTNEEGGALAIADFNGDGFLDIATVFPNEGDLLIFPGEGGGAYGPPVGPKDAGGTGSGLLVADLNNDGKPDLATCNIYSNTVAVVLNGVSPSAFTPTQTSTPSQTRTPTRTRTSTRTQTASRTPTPTVSATASPIAAASATPSPGGTPCPGDCDGNRVVSPEEVNRVVSIIANCQPCPGGSGGQTSGCAAAGGIACTAADQDRDGCISAGELTRILFDVSAFAPTGCP